MELQGRVFTNNKGSGGSAQWLKLLDVFCGMGMGTGNKQNRTSKPEENGRRGGERGAAGMILTHF